MVEKAKVKKVRGPRKKQENKCEKSEESSSPAIPKKRGRKPKGGKIVKKEINIEELPVNNQVIILHLKCKQSDINDNLFTKINSEINYDPNIIKEVEAYSKEETDSYYKLNSSKNEEVIYNVIDESKNKLTLEESNVVNDRETTLFHLFQIVL